MSVATIVRARPRAAAVAVVSLASLAMVAARPPAVTAEEPADEPASATLGDRAAVGRGGVTTIAFGSCNREDGPQDFWRTIAAHDPDLFLFIGDNVYADITWDEQGRERMAPPASAEQIRAAWDALAASDQWNRFRADVPVLATWDDHDFGNNDAGSEWVLKEDAQRIFLDFFGVPEDSPRREREGIYHAETVGPPGRRVQLILLDTRFHRDPLERKTAPGPHGPYRPTADTSPTILGDEQWAWLEERLREPAEVRIIASSIQVVAWEHGWETWGNFPRERARLFELIARTGAGGVLFVSGDRHLVELTCSRGEDGVAVPYPMWDFTSSGLNQGEGIRITEPNRYRVGPSLREPNYGLIRIDWEAPTGPAVTLEGRSPTGDVLTAASIDLVTLRPDRIRR